LSKAALFGIILGTVTPLFSQAQTTPSPVVEPTATSKAIPLNARRLAPENAYTRVYCVVPIVGSGTPADPRRPMFAPAPPTATAPLDRTGIVAYQFQESDDGNFALAEFVSVARTGLTPVLASVNPNVIFFERGKYTRQQIETVFQKYKKNFSFTSFMPVRAQ
jgi:hypothetical protein